MTRHFFNSRAEVWDKTVAEKDVAKLESMAGRLSIAPGSAVLDVGTGTGVFVPFLLRLIGQNGRLVCLDYAGEMLARAKNKGFIGSIQYLCSDIHQCGLPDLSFDAVVCYSSFPHFIDKPVALREIYRMLKRSGRLFICHTSSRRTINNIHSQIPDVRCHLIPDEYQMHSLLAAAGFSEILILDNPDAYFVRAVKPA